LVEAIIEIPKGGRVKYKVDQELGILRFDKVLPMGMVFPFNFGSIPSTLAPDGDPLDVIVLMEEPLAVGSMVTVELAAAIEAMQEQKDKTIRNDRIISVLPAPEGQEPAQPPTPEQIEEIESFFIAYNQLQDRRFVPLARGGSDRAKELLAQARARCKGREGGRKSRLHSFRVPA